ncbi:MAG: CNP1-like family protein [Neisseria sp.]|nr:CNP1-like family protein [Neisseria sp.]
MRRIILLAAALLAAQAQAYGGFNQKDTDYNTRFVETEDSRSLAGFNESEIALPDFPNAHTPWIDIDIVGQSDKTVQIAENSIILAPDRSVRYLLNMRPKNGSDNLSVEALYCATNTFGASKRSSYKTYAYGDSTNRRWIRARNPQWQDLGQAFNSGNPIRAELYKAWCVDGLPSSTEGLKARLNERAGRFPASGSLTNKDNK